MDNITFGQWLEMKLSEKGMRQVDLEKRSGLHSGVISNLIRNKRNAGLDTCKKISRALDIPLTEVYQAAGHMSNSDSHQGNLNDSMNPLIRSILKVISRLSDNEKKDVEEYARLRLRRDKGRSTSGESSRLP